MFCREQVVDHDPQNVAYTGIRHRVNDLLAMSLGSQHARGAEKPQVVTYERSRDTQLIGDVAG